MEIDAVMGRRAGGVVAVAGVLASSATAWACPACATREGPGATVFALIGAMIAVPYVVAVIALRVIRRLERES